MLGKFIKEPCEDSLTAGVFSHLFHLPATQFWPLLRHACSQAGLPQEVGEPTVAYWPKWPADRTDNSRYVEPDVFLRFDGPNGFDLIVEAKRWDGEQQTRAQWQRELQAYVNEFGSAHPPVYLLALGSSHHEPHVLPLPDSTHTCCIFCSPWRTLLTACQLARRRHPAPPPATLRVLDDIIGLFATHRFPVGQWWPDLPFTAHRLSPRARFVPPRFHSTPAHESRARFS